MNRWECQFANCGRTVVGVGGAIGLRAIGWWFALGPEIFCPEHYPVKIPCHGGGEYEGFCSLCAAEDQAKAIQDHLWEADK